MKILHVSDEHIRDRDIEEIEKCLAFIVEKAAEENPDLIISAGDLFDSQDVKMGSRSALVAVGFISALADIAPVAIILGTPSHEGRAPEILRFARGNCPIKVASVPEQFILEAGEFKTAEDNEGFGFQPDAIITLIPTPTKQFFQTTAGIEGSDQEIGQAMSGLFAGFAATAAEYPGVPHILVGHWQVSGSTMSNGQVATGRDIQVSVDQMMMANPDLICLGHIHLPQQMGERVFYSSSIYANNIGEDHKHGFYIHRNTLQMDNRNLFVSDFIETPCKRTVRFKYDEYGGVSGTAIEDIKGAIVRVDISVFQDEAGSIDRAAMQKHFLDLGALSVDIRINAVPRETIRAAAVLEAETLKDEFSEMAKLRGETLDPEILVMAERLENVPADELLKEIA